MSLRDKILSANDIESEVIPVPEWDCSVEVRGMTVAQRDKVVSAGSELKAIYKEIIINLLYDPETGEQIFDEKDGDAILGKSGVVIERLAKKASELSGISDTAVTDAEKN